MRRADDRRGEDREQAAGHVLVEPGKRDDHVREGGRQRSPPTAMTATADTTRPPTGAANSCRSWISDATATEQTTNVATPDSDSMTRTRAAPRMSWWTNIAGTASPNTATRSPSWLCANTDTTASDAAAAPTPMTRAPLRPCRDVPNTQAAANSTCSSRDDAHQRDRARACGQPRSRAPDEQHDRDSPRGIGLDAGVECRRARYPQPARPAQSRGHRRRPGGAAPRGRPRRRRAGAAASVKPSV